MMIRFVWRMAILLLFVFTAGSAVYSQQKLDYEKEWKLIDSLIEKKNLPKTALQQVSQLYRQAHADGNVDQAVKALTYQLSLSTRIGDNRSGASVARIDSALKTPINRLESALLWSLKAQYYISYLQQNWWRTDNRTDTFATKTSDWETWTTRDFQWHIYHSFQNAFMDSTALQQGPVAKYAAVVFKGNAAVLRPTLYDLVLQNALAYYGNPFRGLATSSRTDFLLTDTAVFASPDGFLAYRPGTADTVSPARNAISLFQRLLRFHRPDKNKDALLDLENQRLEWAYAHYAGDQRGKDSLYVGALRRQLAAYPNHPVALQTAYLLAVYYNNLADKFAADRLDTASRYKRLTALDVIHRYFPADSVYTEGWFNLRNLQRSIETPNMVSAKIEAVNIPEKPMLVWLKSYQVKQLFAKVVPLRYEEEKKGNADSLLKVRKAVQQFTVDLPKRDDYQSFSTEIKLNGLPAGNYLLALSEDPAMEKSHVSLFVKVSGLAYFGTKGDLFAVDRETGAPIAGVRLYLPEKNSEKLVDGQLSRLVSDKNGHLLLKMKKGSGYLIGNGAALCHGTDTLSFNIYGISSREEAVTGPIKAGGADELEKEREKNAAARYLTDRNIYRPGQLVSFKGIIATKDSAEGFYHSWKLPQPVTVYLQDANGQKIDSLSLPQDDYGTVQGQFRLPTGRLTGRYTIRDNFSHNNVYFQVEEYKRPTYFVEMDTLKGAYRLNDRISVTGTAIAYNGSKVGNAQVKIHVERATRFSYFWLRPSGFNPSSANVLDTVVRTDEQGKFSFAFLAQPEDAVDSSSFPVFRFRSTVEVTDLNGETRTAENSIAIGFRSVELGWNVSNEAKLHSLADLRVAVKNTNGMPLALPVRVNIRPLKDPHLLLRSKYWQQPDIQWMDSLSYKKDFPHDVYGRENEVASWEKGASVLDMEVPSDSAVPFRSPQPYGWYYLEATVHTPAGEILKDFRYIHYTDEQQWVDNQYLEAFNAYAVAYVGDTVRQAVASAADTVHVVETHDDVNGAPAFTHFILNKADRSYTTVLEKLSQHPLRRTFALYKDNRFYQVSLQISAMAKTEKLDVRIATFRDKVVPGSKEKWTVTVWKSGARTDNAQLLSTMYDASLDQILDGNWSYAFSGPSYTAPYVYFNSSLNNSINSQNLTPSRLPVEYIKTYPRLVFDRISLAGGSLDEVVTVGYGVQRKESRLFAFTTAISSKEAADGTSNGDTLTLTLRGTNSVNTEIELYVVDGQVLTKDVFSSIPTDDIISVQVLKGEEAVSLYGAQAANGAIVITTKSKKYGSAAIIPELRSNFNETAFFYPDIRADKEGNYKVEFDMPDAVTRWRWRNLAIDRDLHMGYTEQRVISQKTLMVQPNLPRFLRAGDSLDLSMKITNIGEKALQGWAYMQLLDGDSAVLHWQEINRKDFSAQANNSAVVHFNLAIPEDYAGPLYVKTWAEGGNYSDGELHEIPVLSRKILVTETGPFELKGDTTVHLSLATLKESIGSKTIQSQNLTIEVATNPVWYAVQALPYLAYYNYECSEQLFNRMYAGFLAQTITSRYPQIRQVLQKWEKDPEALKSNLQKNEAVRQVVLEETPWMKAAESEAEQKRNIALLYNKDTVEALLARNFEKLSARQLPDGSFTWYEGTLGDRYITQYMVMQYARLLAVGAVDSTWKKRLSPVMAKAGKWLATRVAADYGQLKKNKADLTKNQTGTLALQYLYATCLLEPQHRWTDAESYYLNQSKKYWNSFSLLQKAWIADLYYRIGQKNFAVNTVLRSLLENAVESPASGLYWKSSGNRWGFAGSPIEDHSQIMVVVDAIAKKEKSARLGPQVQEMQHWLIRNKHTNYWYNTKATADACFATLMTNRAWVVADPAVQIRLGDTTIHIDRQEAGTGYAKVVIPSSGISPARGDMVVSVSGNPGYIYGGIYWQYLENIDKVSRNNNALSLDKKLYKEVISNGVKNWQEVGEKDILAVGDRLMVRIAIRSDRDLQYVHLKDLRPSDTEPDAVLSGYHYQNGLGYYNSVQDVSNNYFFNSIPKGVHVLEYTLHLTHAGTFASGLASIQCMYAPEIGSHSEGRVLQVQ